MINYRYVRRVVGALLAFSLLTCAAQSENILLPVVQRERVSISTPTKDISEASNRFGFKLFQKLTAASPRDSNVCISPLSISSALTMTYNGAAGKTRDAMASTLEIAGRPVDLINDSYRQLGEVLAAADHSLDMEIANSIWYRQGLKVKASFLDLSRTGFDAAIRELDFANSAEADKINLWIKSKTDNHIKTIIAPPIDPDVMMMLINAVYFKAPWTTSFDGSLTQPARFNLLDGSQAECRMMQRLGEYQYIENELFQAADLPYGNRQFSMTVLLPRAGIAVDELIGRIEPRELTNWVNGLSGQTMRLSLPRFRFSGDFGLNEALKSIGLNHSFAGQQADFSNMTDGRLWIDSVIHKTFIQVDEQGTEAAAATAVIMEKGFVPSMVVDRPFIFLIRHRETNSVLFLGKVVNPLWEKEA